MISILCVQRNSNYYKIPGLDLWDIDRDAYNYTGNNPVITHAPCAQWSMLREFAYYNKREKELAFFCWEKVNGNGGIFEHPAGSSFFKQVKFDKKNLFRIQQSWWGFRGRKSTLLYYVGCRPMPLPLCFDSKPKLYPVEDMSKNERALMPLSFCHWLIDSIKIDFNLGTEETEQKQNEK